MAQSPYTALKIATVTWMALAVLGMFIGLQIAKTGLAPIGILVAAIGALSAAQNFTRLIRIQAAERVLLETGAYGRTRGGAGPGADLPREIFLLLAAVAEVDGRAEPRERDLVRAFVLQRFPDPRVHADLASWNAQPIPPDQIGSLVRGLRVRLSRSECETLFTWCCLVAMIDERFGDAEHDMLQEIARHFGIEPVHARRLFHHAKLRVLGQRTRAGGSWSGAQGSYGRQRQWGSAGNGGSPYREQHLSGRARALEVLGLDANASPDDIRKRHRELVKKYHPDAHANLGEVAAKEATERFREVQEAYETLTA